MTKNGISKLNMIKDKLGGVTPISGKVIKDIGKKILARIEPTET